MNLNGGYMQYVLSTEGAPRYLDGDAPYGRKVVYLDENGWDSEPVLARKQGLVKGNIYTVKEIYVGRSSSEVELVEVDGRFNSVMFEDVE